jgi:hypothetical protein
LLTTYWHLLPLTALLLDDELLLEELVLTTELELLDLTLLEVELERDEDELLIGQAPEGLVTALVTVELPPLPSLTVNV